MIKRKNDKKINASKGELERLLVKPNEKRKMTIGHHNREGKKGKKNEWGLECARETSTSRKQKEVW